MAISFYNNTNDSLPFEEFIKIINDKIKSCYDLDGLLNCHTDLHALSNNESFFIDFINDELVNNIKNFQIENFYTNQSFILYRNEKFFIRVNWWPVFQNAEKHYDKLVDNFSYNAVHDHNFSLLTVGYKGAYTTKLWEYNYEDVIGFLGEKVKTEFLEETDLDKGKVMFYRPSRDIHKQLMPKKEFSISVNIILDSPAKNMQFLFDEESFTIKRFLYHPMRKFGSIFRFVEQYQNEETKNILESLIKNPDPFIRLEAYSVLSKVTQSDMYWDLAKKDKVEMVSYYAKLESNNLLSKKKEGLS